jgi:heme-degrading monooxygenase HmoA
VIGLFFEVEPLPGHAVRYFDLAAHLRPELNKNPGMLFIDRYESLDRPHIVLSHSWWDSEASLIAWREHTGHRAIQRAGRERHFKDYRIRIGRELGNVNGKTKLRLTVDYLDDAPYPHADIERFRSVYRDGKYLSLCASTADVGNADRRTFEIIRDYTMYDRAQAPQDYPAVERR